MSLLPQNVGQTDRIVRILLGILLIAASVYIKTTAIAIGLGIVALVMLEKALIGSCTLYLPFGISTKRIQKR